MFSARRQNNSVTKISWSLMVLASLSTLACGDTLDEPDVESDTLTRQQALEPMCQVNVRGVGMVDVEDDYLPRVVTCENGNAPFEALKAQAVAARTYAKFKMETSGSLIDGQGDQVYSCSRQPSEDAIRAVRETAGQILVHNDTVLASFYVSGVMPSADTCVPNSSDIARASSIDRNVERYVTYNRGKTANAVSPSSLGHPGNPRNRGCMSQNGSSCLSNQGRDYQSILRFYYGDDVRLTQLGGTCGGATPDQNSGPVQPEPNTPANPQDPGTTPLDTSGGADPTAPAGVTDPCVNSGMRANVVPRSQWGATTASANRRAHTPNRVTFHHTATPAGFSGPDAVRQIQNWHKEAYGFFDIGYHYVIDQDGTIYEGTPVDRMGAHKKGDNDGNIGVAFIGDFSNGGQPSTAQQKAGMQLAFSLGNKFGFDLSASNILGGFFGEKGAKIGGIIDSILDFFFGSGSGNGMGTGSGSSTGVCGKEPSGPTQGGETAQFNQIRFTASASNQRSFPLDRLNVADVNGTLWLGRTIVEESQVQNSAGVAGSSAATSCSDIAQIAPGGSLVVGSNLSFETFLSGQEITIFNGGAVATGCNLGGTAKIEVSRDGQEWYTLAEMSNGEGTFTLPTVDSSSPGNNTPGNNSSGTPGNNSSGTPDPGINTGGEPGGNDGSGGSTVAGVNIDTAAANRLAQAARRVDGRSSGGYCWRGVKESFTQAGYQRSSLDAMGNYGPCSSYNFQLSAYCGGRNFNGNAMQLMQHLNMQKIDVHPTEAPVGAVIFWDRGCNGFHATHGHVEIAIGDGRACSDYCGRLRSGGGSCSYVFVPVQ